ncbi:MAG: cob(I)yrinic acid a,c-diamide adenosyltransferase [Clostridia bacterium]|nr:cob(I)yrinic acid a,c-diamide adenosyltransferase [Clostridia bacterium]
MEKGLIQVYTGEGKGKTTAAVGQGIRALGRGNRVYMVQFLKSGPSGELEIIKRLEPDFKLFRFEKQRGFVWTLNEEQREELKGEIRKGFEFIKMVLNNKECDVLIIDEIMGVLSNKFLDVNEVVGVLKNKPESIEIIMTGRNVPEEIAEAADYISDIKCVKHPLQKGIPAREGIEF